MKRLFSFLALASFITLAAPAQSAKYALNVENFSELEVVDGINVEYKCNPDSAGWVAFECEPDMASKITFTNKNNRLTIQSTAEEEPYENMPTVRVYSAALQKVTNSGDSTLTVHSCVPVKKFTVRQIGNGNIRISGASHNGKLANVGTGNIYADDLVIEKATCLVLGSGSIYCSPVENLKIFGAGSGQVIYTNTPEKVQNRSIGVKSIALIKEHSTSEFDNYLTQN